MATTKQRLDQRKELKFRRQDQKDIADAARVTGINESAFIRTAAIEKAHKILEAEKVSLLSNDEWNNFTDAIARYTKAPKDLKQNMKEFLTSYKNDI